MRWLKAEGQAASPLRHAATKSLIFNAILDFQTATPGGYMDHRIVQTSTLWVGFR